MCQAATGIGKTLSYLIAAIIVKRGRLNDFWNPGFYPEMSTIDAANMPIVIATSSIALQKALLTEYIPNLSEILVDNGIIRTPISAVLRKGKNHKICDRLLNAQIKFETDSEIKTQLEALQHTLNIDLDESSLPQRIKDKICVSDGCNAKDCSQYGMCRY